MIQVAYDPIYEHPLPENHRFPMEKYGLLHAQILHQGIVEPQQIISPNPASAQEILLTHQPSYLEKLLSLSLTKPEIRRTGFPLSKELIDREIKIMGGSIQAAYHALTHGAALNIAGGTHHAYPDRGEGFCLLNDLAIAVETLRSQKKIRKALIIDLDVHQGNGTAVIFEKINEVFTFSMHGKSNYPMRKEKSDLDIALPDLTEDDEYLEILETQLPGLIDSHKPDFIAYQSGVDALKTDKLGRLGLSLEGLKRRDEIVFDHAHKLEIPIIAAMGGGYSPNIKDIVDAHTQTFQIAADLFG